MFSFNMNQIIPDLKKHLLHCFLSRSVLTWAWCVSASSTWCRMWVASVGERRLDICWRTRATSRRPKWTSGMSLPVLESTLGRTGCWPKKSCMRTLICENHGKIMEGVLLQKNWPTGKGRSGEYFLLIGKGHSPASGVAAFAGLARAKDGNRCRDELLACLVAYFFLLTGR